MLHGTIFYSSVFKISNLIITAEGHDIIQSMRVILHPPCLFMFQITMQYHNASSETKLPPHIYGIAEKSYKHLLHNKRSQCHVISGESGAGKSESCKYIIQHLLRVAGSEETNLNSKINQVNLYFIYKTMGLTLKAIVLELCSFLTKNLKQNDGP